MKRKKKILLDLVIWSDADGLVNLLACVVSEKTVVLPYWARSQFFVHASCNVQVQYT